MKNQPLVLSLGDGAKAAPLSARDSLQDAVGPVLSVMRCFAAWPAHKPRDLCTALQAALQAALLVVLVYRWVAALTDRMAYFASGLVGSERTVIAIQGGIYLVMFWTLPLIWWDATRLPVIWGRWGCFQARLERVCPGSLLSSSRSRSLFLAVLLAASWPPFIAASLSFLSEAEMSPLNAVFFAHPTLVVLSLKLLWWRMLVVAEQGADLLVRSARKDVGSWSRPGAAPAARLREYRELWVFLRDFLDAVGRKGGLSALVVHVMQALSLLLFALQTVLSAIRGFSFVSQWMAVLGVITLLTTAVLCDAGQRVSDKMGKMAAILEASPSASLSPQMEYELEVFRETMRAKAAEVRLCGFVPLNRSSLGSVAVVLMTYLMVLLQFALL